MFGQLDLSFGDDHFFIKYQCSLCHALGKDYGSLARFLTNYDMALCLAIISNFMGNETPGKRKICPLLKRNEIIGSDHPLMRYLSAVTILLVSEKIKDDIYDENRKFPKKLLSWVDRRSLIAKEVLEQLGFEPNLFEEAFTRQRDLENMEGLDFLELAEPTAQVMLSIYYHSAQLTQMPENQKALGQIGYSLGQIIYLLDSLEDYRIDLETNSFNPIHKCFSRELEKNPSFVPNKVKESISCLLKSANQNILISFKNMPGSDYLQANLVPSLEGLIEEKISSPEIPVKEDNSSFWAGLKRTVPISWLSTPGLAFASNGKEGGAGCYSSLTFLLIMLFAYAVICRGCLGKRGCSSQPNQVTVDHGCGGRKTYERDPCTGRYKEGGCC